MIKNNELAGVLYFGGVFVISAVAGQILYLLMAPIYKIMGPNLAHILSVFLGLVILYLSILITANIFKKIITYSDPERVVIVATIISAILSFFSIARVLPNLDQNGSISVVVSLVSIYIFYIVSKKQL